MPKRGASASSSSGLAGLLHRFQDFVAARDLVFVLALAVLLGVAGRTRH